MAVDIQLHRAGDIQLRQRGFHLLIAVDAPPRSTRLCRPEVRSLQVLIDVDIQLSWLIYRPRDTAVSSRRAFALDFCSC